MNRMEFEVHLPNETRKVVLEQSSYNSELFGLYLDGKTLLRVSDDGKLSVFMNNFPGKDYKYKLVGHTVNKYIEDIDDSLEAVYELVPTTVKE